MSLSTNAGSRSKAESGCSRRRASDDPGVRVCSPTGSSIGGCLKGDFYAMWATATELGEMEIETAKAALRAKRRGAHRPCIVIGLQDFDASERCPGASELRRTRCSARRYRCRCHYRRLGSMRARWRTARSSPDCSSRGCRRLRGSGCTSSFVYTVCTSCSVGRGHISLGISWHCCSCLQSEGYISVRRCCVAAQPRFLDGVRHRRDTITHTFVKFSFFFVKTSTGK